MRARHKSNQRASRWRRWVSATVVWLMLFGVCHSAFAKDQIKLSDEQIVLNNRAVQLLAESPPQAAEAIRVVEAALVLGQRGDLLYLTLGRAYQLSGQCEKALESFNQAEEAPHVEGLPAGFVPNQLKVYRGQVDSLCPGTLVVECQPSRLTLMVGQESMTCGEPKSLKSGTYKVDATNAETGASVSMNVLIQGAKTTRTTVQLLAAKPQTKVSEPKDQNAGLPKRPPPHHTPEPPWLELWGGASAGYCTTQLRNEAVGATATDVSVCYGVDAGARVWGPVLGLISPAVEAHLNGVMAHPLTRYRRAVATRGVDAEVALQGWLRSRRLAVEVVGAGMGREVVLEEMTADVRAWMVGPGGRWRVWDDGAYKHVELRGRWMFGGDNTGAWSASVRGQWERVFAVVGYTSWGAEPRRGDGELAQEGLVLSAEQVMATLGVLWSMP